MALSVRHVQTRASSELPAVPGIVFFLGGGVGLGLLRLLATAQTHLFVVIVVGHVPKLNVTILATNGKHLSLSRRRTEGERVDGRRHVIHEPTPMHLVLSSHDGCFAVYVF